MKYKSEIGESMEKPSKKLKKIILITGVTGVVYASFKYLLPLVIPFLIAYAFALALRPSAVWLEGKFKITIKNRTFRLPLAVIGGVEILILSVLLGIGVYMGGRKLCEQASLLIDNLPMLIERLDVWLTGNCIWFERVFHLPEGCMVGLLRDMLKNMGNMFKDTAMPFLVVNSMTILKWAVQAMVITVILFVATMLSLQEMDSLRERRNRSMFRREFAMLSNRLVTVGNAYLKTQGIIIILTILICMIGLTILKNPYSVLLGIGIGVLDALPIFGTGTVLIPWGIFQMVKGNWFQAVMLIGIYVVCYLIREVLEAKIMAGQVGLTPLETLIAMYVGLQLFGLLGFVLGPIGLLIIEDVVEACEGVGKDC